MSSHSQVKTRILAVLMAACASAAILQAQDAPNAQEILKNVRFSQTQEHRVLNGELRNDRMHVPFRLTLDGNTIRYDFSNPPQALVLQLGDEGAQLKEVTGSGSEKISPARYDEKVRGTDLTFEDISLRFLYWKNAKVIGDDRVITRDCYKLELHPGKNDASQYGTVFAWVDKGGGALLKVECYGRDGRLAMRFSLKSVQRSRTEEGIWLPKDLRIERMEGDRPKDPSPTYLEIRE